MKAFITRARNCYPVCGIKNTLRLFSSSMDRKGGSQQQGITELYTQLRDKENGIYKDKSPLEVIYMNQGNIDLPSFDLLFEKFINAEWGINPPRGPTQIAQKVIEFMSATNDLGIALSKEQLCKLVIEFYSQGFISVTPPYSRFEALKIISNLETRSSNSIQQTPYYDELHDFYQQEYDFVKSKILDIQSPKTLVSLAQSMRSAKYNDPKIFQQISFVYKMITSFDMETPPQVKTLYDVSEILQCLTFYNIPKQDLYRSFVAQLSTLLQGGDSLPQNADKGQLVKLKFILNRFLRYQSLFPIEEGNELAKKAISLILKDLKKNIDMQVEDYNQIYQYLLLQDQTDEALMAQLRTIWDKSNKETTVTKFEQEVLDSLKRLPLKYEKNTSDPATGLELDMIVSEYKGRPLKLAVEVNGVYHYARNSEEPLGRDVLKHRILSQQGYKILVIPYYQWYILEEAQKPKFLKDVIEHCIL